MSQNILDFFKATYQNDSACILIFDPMYNLLWHNDMPAPFDLSSNIPALLRFPKEGPLVSGDYSYSINNTMYEYHLTNAADEFYIISCSLKPVFSRIFDSKYSRESLENTLAFYRQETLSISTAAAQLNEYFEGFEDDSISSKELNEQTNIIMKNCSRMLKTEYLIQELLRYYEPLETEEKILDCSEVVKIFAKNCKDIFGPRGSTTISCEDLEELPICVSPQRLEFFLLCVLITMHTDDYQVYHLVINARQISDEVSISMKLTPVGDEKPKDHLISEFVPLYKNTPIYEIEHMIIRRFLERYNGVIINSAQGNSKTISVRFPVADVTSKIQLEAPKNSICGESIITPYHALLSEITDFRYY